MATIANTTDRNTVNGATLVTWEAMGNADSGAAFAVPYSADLSFQVAGTFGSATVTFQGSNDGTNWSALTQQGGTTSMAYTTAGLRTAQEMPAFVRPITAGGTGTDVDVILAIHARYAKAPY